MSTVQVLHGLGRELRKSQRALQNVKHFAASTQLVAIKDLRERSGAPITDVKAALTESGWDLGKAFDVLRKKGLAAATKKASRGAAEGLVAVAKAPGAAAVIEVNSETDFVARNDQFRTLLTQVAQAALQMPDAAVSGASEVDLDALSAVTLPDGTRVTDAVAGLVGTVRENIRLRRAFKLSCPHGVVSSYLHSSPAPGLGKIGVLVAIEATNRQPLQNTAAEQVQALGRKLAMHAAAAKPQFLSRDVVTTAALEAEKRVLWDQAVSQGKPENIIEKMVIGRLNKFYEEVCFVDQKFVMDETLKVQNVVSNAGKELGLDLRVAAFVRLQCGEGLDVPEAKGFADEVAEALQSASA